MDLEDRFDKAFQNGNVSELKKKGYISGKAVGEMVWKMETMINQFKIARSKK